MKLIVCKVVLLFQIIVLVRTLGFKRYKLVVPLSGRFLDLYVRVDAIEAILLSKKKLQNGTIHLERSDSKPYPDSFRLSFHEFEFTANYLDSNESLIVCQNQFEDGPRCIFIPIVFSIDSKWKPKLGEYLPMISMFKDYIKDPNIKDPIRDSKVEYTSVFFRMFSKNGQIMITSSVHVGGTVEYEYGRRVNQRDLSKLAITRYEIDSKPKSSNTRQFLYKTGAAFESVTGRWYSIVSFESDGYAYYFRIYAWGNYFHREIGLPWYLTRVCLDDSSRELKSQSTIVLNCAAPTNRASGPRAAYFDRDDRKLYIWDHYLTCEFEMRMIAYEFEQNRLRCHEEFSDSVKARMSEDDETKRPCSYYKPTYESMEGHGTTCLYNDTCNPPECAQMFHLENDAPVYGKVVMVRKSYYSAYVRHSGEEVTTYTPTDFIVVNNRELRTKQAFVRNRHGTVFMVFLNSSINQSAEIPGKTEVWSFASKSRNTYLVEMADRSGVELIDGDRLFSFKPDCSLYLDCPQLLNETQSEQARRLWQCGWCRLRDGRELSTNESECRKSRGIFLNVSCLPATAKCLESERWLSNETGTLTIRGDFPRTFDYRIKVCGSECQDTARSENGTETTLTCFSTPPYTLVASSFSTSSQPSCVVVLIVLNPSDASVLTELRVETCGGPLLPPTMHTPLLINPLPTDSHPPSTPYVPAPTPSPDHYPPTDQSNISGWYVSAGIITFLVILGVGYFLHRMRKRRARNQRRRADESALPMIGQPDFRLDHEYVHPRSQTENAQHIRPITHGNYEDLSHVVPSKLLIQNELIELERLVGRGHFGQVFKAMYKPEGDQMSVPVAVKTLLCKENARQFLQEGMIMETFKHENVLSLIGISFEADNLPMIVTPFMTKGDLLTYIRHPQNSPDMNQLLTFGLEIAAGMQYLHKSKFIHRDLAARNCMLDENLRVKVADFGLSRDVYETEAYLSSQNMELPIRWMPPESIELKVYSYKSDVWSYGVVLWELCTRGKIPYGGRSGFEVLSYLKSGHRLERFDTTPEEVDKLMRTCWMLAPNERPDFTTLVDRLPELIDRLKANVLRVPPYYNTT